MFAPTKVYRKWHYRSNLNQKRYAICSALAASAVPSLVMARGHKISQVAEIPLVISQFGDIEKTKQAVALLKSIQGFEDVQKAKDSKTLRAGKGKMRNRRYKQRLGPLIVYSAKSQFIRAFRNLPGVDLCNVSCLNLLQLAPGGHLGRFIIWTKDAFSQLDRIYGTYNGPSELKKDYRLPRSIITNPDLGRIINSDEIQSVVRPKKKVIRYFPHKKNPLTNLGAMVKLNPYVVTARRKELLYQEKAREHKEEHMAKKRAIRKKRESMTKKLKKQVHLFD